MSNNSPQIKTQLVVFFEVNFKLVKMRHVLSNIFDFVQFALDTNEFWFNVGFLLSHDSGLAPGYVTTFIKTFANERGIVSCVQVTVSKRCVEVWREHFHCRGVTFSLVFSNLFILICCLNWRKEHPRNSKRNDRNKCLYVRCFCFSTRRPRLSWHFSPLFRRLSFFHDPCEIMNI